MVKDSSDDGVIAIDVRFEYVKVVEDEGTENEYAYYELAQTSRIRNDLGDAASSLGEVYAQSDHYHVHVSEDLIGVISDGDVVNYAIS